MEGSRRRTFWFRARLWFRRARLTVWMAVLALVAASIYLNQVGLPEVLKRPLCDQLRQRGVEFQFSRLRWLPPAGIVADQVHIGTPDDAAGPRMSVRRAEVDLDWRQLLRGRLQVEALGLRDGQFVWPLIESNAPPETIRLEDVQARVRLLPDDEWVVDDFRARFAGVRLFLSGMVTNASALRSADIWRPRSAGRDEAVEVSRVAPGTARQHLRHLAGIFRQVTFATPPDLRLVLTGDARAPETFALRLSALAGAVQSPWGSGEGLRVNLRLFAATAERPARVEATLEAADASLPWAKAKELGIQLSVDAVAGQPGLVEIALEARSAAARCAWAEATNVSLTARWTHALTNPVPLVARLETRAGVVSNRWAVARQVSITTALAAASAPVQPQSGRGWWTNVWPYGLDWTAAVKEVRWRALPTAELTCAGHWSAPEVTVTNLEIGGPAGWLRAEGRLDVSSGDVGAALASSADLRAMSAWLPARVRAELERLGCYGTGCLTASLAAQLPPWLATSPDRDGTLSGLRLAGELALTNAGCAGVAVDWGRARFSHTNGLWLLPEVALGRAEGQLRGNGQWQAETGEFAASFHSNLSPEWLRPLYGDQVRRVLDLFSFSQPPVIEIEASGRFDALERATARGRVAATNFTFRGTPVAVFTSDLAYHDRQLEAIEPRLWRGTNHLRAARVRADFASRLVQLTDAFGSDDPQIVTRAIGPKTARALEPYRFDRPPEVRLNGTIPMQGHEGADLWAEVWGGPFRWWKLRVAEITGTVHWQGEVVALTNVTTSFYGGRAQGWGVFDTQRATGTDVRFTLSVSNADCHALMSDLTTPTNRLEGTLNARLVVTDGNTADWRSWQGEGEAQLRDGWIWSIPLFGVLSGPLDSLVPGLGNSRVTSGSGTFVLTNGVLRSDDLEWRAQAMRLQYQGTVDLEGRVNATVQAELLRDTWLVGRLVSLALWPVSKVLEFKVTGTLAAPRAEPLYIPKLLTVPLRPWQTLKELFAPRDKPEAPSPPSNP